MLTTSIQELKGLNSCLRDEHTALQLAFASLEDKLRKVQVSFDKVFFSTVSTMKDPTCCRHINLMCAVRLANIVLSAVCCRRDPSQLDPTNSQAQARTGHTGRSGDSRGALSILHG